MSDAFAHRLEKTERADAPFLVEHRREGDLPTNFLPNARLAVAPALRNSGLLAALGDRELRTLLALLTFLTPDGRFTATVPAIASALRIPEKEAVERLRSLMARTFEDAALIVEVPREQSLPTYVPGPRLVRHVLGETAENLPVSLAIPTVGRETLVALNREKYSKPRADVERVVAAQLGRDPLESEDSPQGAAYQRMVTVGVARDEARRLIDTFPLGDITRQLDWLPYREPRLPSRFLVAAIEKGYDAPNALQEAGEALDAAVPAET